MLSASEELIKKVKKRNFESKWKYFKLLMH